MLKVVKVPARHQPTVLPISTTSISFVGIGVQINHVACLFCSLGAGVHGNSHISLCKRRSVIGAVTGHRHEPAACLVLPDELQLCLRCCLGKKVIHPCLGCDRRGSERVISCDHDRLMPMRRKFRKPFFDSAFDNVIEADDAEDLFPFSQPPAVCAFAAMSWTTVLIVSRKVPALAVYIFFHSV